MLGLPTAAGIVLALVSVVGIYRFAIKVIRRDEVRLKAMSDEIEAIISAAAAGRSGGLLPEILLPFAEKPEFGAASETVKSLDVPSRKAAKTSHERCAADFIPHQYRDEIAA